jgi:hypothetical protein
MEKKINLRKLIKEEINSFLQEKEDTNPKFTSMLNQLLQMAETGELDLDNIRRIESQLMTARRRGQQTKRSSDPDFADKKSSAIQKSKDTRKQSKDDLEKFMQRSREQDDNQRKETQARRNNNQLPQLIDAYSYGYRKIENWLDKLLPMWEDYYEFRNTPQPGGDNMQAFYLLPSAKDIKVNNASEIWRIADRKI